MRLLRVLLLAILFWTPAWTSEAQPAPQLATLAVPFLPQTEALCGGAAAAMIFRFWGDRHADVQVKSKDGSPMKMGAFPALACSLL